MTGTLRTSRGYLGATPRALLALAIATCSLVTHAEFYTGNDLLSRMTSDEAPQRAAAIGYIMGVTDAGMGVTHCTPADVTAGQIRDMMRNYLTNTPAERHLTADTLINRVLKATWPCARRSSSGSGT